MNEPTQEKKPASVDTWLLGFIGVCLVAFLVASLWQDAPAGAAGQIKEVMQWFGLALGIGGAVAATKSKLL